MAQQPCNDNQTPNTDTMVIGCICLPLHYNCRIHRLTVVRVFELGFTIVNLDFVSDLNNPTSVEFRALQAEIEQQVRNILEDRVPEKKRSLKNESVQFYNDDIMAYTHGLVLK